MTAPYPELHRDVVVGPLLPGSNKHQFIFETSPGLDLPHYRFGREDATRRSDMPEETMREAERFDEPTLYAGVFIDHFGHFSAECVHRLYGRRVSPELHRIKVAFHVSGRRGFKPGRWVYNALRLFGVSRNDLVAIDRPLRFSNLYVPLQGRTLGGPSLVPDYPKLLPLAPRAVRAPENADEVLYLSRSKHFFSGSYLGETHVERLLAAAGATVIYPEELETADLVGRLRAARIAIFSEGSAIHNLELCGPTGLRVFVIGRREGVAERLAPMLNDFAGEWRVFEPSQRGIPLDWDVVKQKPSWQRNNAYPRLAALIRELSAFIGRPLPEPTDAEAFDVVSADLARYVLDPRSTRPSTTDEQLGMLIRMMRERHAKVRRAWSKMQGDPAPRGNEKPAPALEPGASAPGDRDE